MSICLGQAEHSLKGCVEQVPDQLAGGFVRTGFIPSLQTVDETADDEIQCKIQRYGRLELTGLDDAGDKAAEMIPECLGKSGIALFGQQDTDKPPVGVQLGDGFAQHAFRFLLVLGFFVLLIVFFHQCIQLILDIIEYLLCVFKVDVECCAVVSGAVGDFLDGDFVDVFFAVQLPECVDEITARLFAGICVGTDRNPFFLVDNMEIITTRCRIFKVFR